MKTLVILACIGAFLMIVSLTLRFTYSEDTVDINQMDLKVDSLQKKIDSLQIILHDLSHNEVDKDTSYVQGYWTTLETKLPEGKVIQMDHSHETENKPVNTFDNYVTIKQSSGELIIVRDIDQDLYLNLQIGDIIQ